MFGNQSSLRVITGNKNRLRLRGFDGSELGTEISVRAAAAEGAFAHDLATMGGKIFFEVFCQPDRVIISHISQNRDFFGFQIIDCEFRHDRSLKRIDKADPKNVVAHLGHPRVG